jgi:hypothetical protein
MKILIYYTGRSLILVLKFNKKLNFVKNIILDKIYKFFKGKQ